MLRRKRKKDINQSKASSAQTDQSPAAPQKRETWKLDTGVANTIQAAAVVLVAGVGLAYFVVTAVVEAREVAAEVKVAEVSLTALVGKLQADIEAIQKAVDSNTTAIQDSTDRREAFFDELLEYFRTKECTFPDR